MKNSFMGNLEKIKIKAACKMKQKSNGDGNLLVAGLLVVQGIIMAGIIFTAIQKSGVSIHQALNNRIRATQQANTWVK